jgi:hypothetical protein
MSKLASTALLIALLAAGCTVKKTETKQAQVPPYVIGTGEIMMANQYRHAKLWFAGEDANWPLAAYEVRELKEGFDDVKTFHPTFKKMPTAPKIDEFVEGPLGELDKAVKNKDKAAFAASFDELTAGCNACHRTFGFGFNVIQRPTAPPVTNQQFEPVKEG